MLNKRLAALAGPRSCSKEHVSFYSTWTAPNRVLSQPYQLPCVVSISVYNFESLNLCGVEPKSRPTDKLLTRQTVIKLVDY